MIVKIYQISVFGKILSAEVPPHFLFLQAMEVRPGL